MNANLSQRDERIDLRLSGEVKTLLARAASYSGMSLSGFLLSAAADKARQVVAEQELLTLSVKDWEAFLAALDQAEQPRPQLEAAARRYKNRRAGADAG
ncbi:DUF1778 domain-containing protein [Methylogaea oryzae]|uniref:DUF1778 domain-containing protein n=1 Tax=Methylogaea oryzae TaxID=1295382 RepID=A0A8D5ALE0_9GAMM|nr:DUF1778 domain-containing protein [Methylogaea oryzae]BBL72749.1 hypothetical protein MoryE10_33550 [Methylogaea oryzae]